MATKEKIIDLKPKTEKITEEQLKELQALVKTINSLQFEVGKIEAQKHELVHRLSNSQSQVVVLQKKFEEEYGTCNIDVNDGSIHREGDDK